MKIDYIIMIISSKVVNNNENIKPNLSLPKFKKKP